MAYRLGVDLGTTFVAAAISYESQIEMVTLGDRSVVTPSVVYLREDNALVTGEAAHRRAPSSPERVAREFKRRLGDPTPVMLAGAPHAVTDLLGAVLRDVLAKVSQTEGEPPERVVLTHPANWGPYRRGLFEEVPRLAGIDEALTTTEPEAAAAHYAASRKLSEGDTVAVYDLGGGTFDVTVLRKQADGIEILGTPEGIERLGGIDFDEAVLSHINFASDGALAELDVRDPAIAVALARLRQDCVLAKESLSVDTETLIPVFLPGRNFDVRITREDFEKLVRAQVESTIGALSRTLRSARLEPDELSAVLLVGGSSRIPLVAEMVSAELGRPIVVDTHPKYAVALGAATLAATAPSDSGPRASATPPPPPKPPAEPEQPTRALQQLLPPVPVAPVPTPGAQSVSAPSVSAQSVSAQSSAPSGPPPTAPATAPPTPLPARNTPSPSYQPPGDPSGYQPPGDPSGYQPPGDPSGYQPPGDPSGYQPPGGGHYQPPGGGTSGYQPPGGGTGYPSADPHAPEQPVWGHPQHPGGAPEQNPYPGQYPEQNPYQGQPQEYGQYPGYGSPTGPGQYPYQGQPQQWHQGPPQATASGNGTGQSVGRAIAYGLALVVLAVVVAYLAFTVVSKLRGLG